MKTILKLWRDIVAVGQKRILLFIKVPPPVTGATLMNKRVHESKFLRQFFNIRSICISYADRVSDIGKFRLKKILKILYILVRLSKELLFHKPAFVYFQISPFRQGFYRDLLFVSLIKIVKVKIVFHLRGKGIKKAGQRVWKRKLYRYAFRDESVICLSKSLTYDIKEVFFDRVYIVNNGLPDIPNHFRTRKGRSLVGNLKVLFLSNLIKSKGVDDFLQALKLLREAGFNFQGLIVGDEGDLSHRQLNEEILNKNLEEEVEYLGKLYGDEKLRLLTEIDVIVFPTKNDAFPAIPIEAMRSALPIIATREGAIEDMVDDGITGYLVDKNAPEQIADSLIMLINEPALRKKMGEAGRRKYEEKYTLQQFEENMKNVFQDVLDDISNQRNYH
jgi:glycosyltransferase involved in cell wall biosynthesis